jgi:hypothetical protein
VKVPCPVKAVPVLTVPLFIKLAFGPTDNVPVFMVPPFICVSPFTISVVLPENSIPD